MKKYNLSKIMKRAWELVKKAGMTISSGLKKAWEEAKETMKGSQKQIAWAKDIISKANKAIEEIENYDQSEFKEVGKILREKFNNAVDNHDDASWWIEHRNSYTRDFIRLGIGNRLLRKLGSRCMLG